jgi:hypothetical protein
VRVGGQRDAGCADPFGATGVDVADDVDPDTALGRDCLRRGRLELVGFLDPDSPNTETRRV